MAQILLLKIDSDGVPVQFTSSTDEITLLSFTVNGGGPVLSGTGLDLNNQDVVDVNDLTFNAPSTGTINQTAGALIIDNIMAKERENTMTTAGGIAFPVITDSAGQVDSFRLPALAGVPTATPTNAGEGHMVWDSSNNRLYVWDGAAWDDQSTVNAAGSVQNNYIADEDIDAREVVYISAADNVSLADVSGSGAASRVLGLAVASVLDTAAVIIQSEGLMTGFTGLTAGARYYANPATPGGITATRPAGTGNTIVQVGYAKSTTALHIHIEQMGRLS